MLQVKIHNSIVGEAVFEYLWVEFSFFRSILPFADLFLLERGIPPGLFLFLRWWWLFQILRKRNEAISHPNQHTNENPAKCVLNAAILFINILEIILAETVQKKHSELHSQASFTSKTFKKCRLSFLFELVIYTFPEIWNFSYFYRPPYLHLRGDFWQDTVLQYLKSRYFSKHFFVPDYRPKF